MSGHIVQPLVIGGLVLAEVGIFQSRIARSNRGDKRSAAALGALGALVYVVAISQVVANVDRPLNLAGYSAGVAVGVYLGCVADERTRRAPLEFRIVLPDGDVGLLGQLRDAGWPATAVPGQGVAGAVSVVFVAVHPRNAAELARQLHEWAPDTFWTVEELTTAHPAPLPAGYRTTGPLRSGRAKP